jgi:hypothetical protein
MRDEHQRLDSRFSLVGAFWRPEAKDTVLCGTLSADSRNLTLTSAPEYTRELRPLSQTIFNDEPPERIPVLHGFSEDGPCCVCELIETHRPGLVHTELRQSVTAVAYHVGICILGMCLGGTGDKSVDSARYTFTGLSEWIPKATTERWGKEAIVIELPLEERDVAAFGVRGIRVDVAVRARPVLTSRKSDNARVSRSVAYVEVRPENPESLSWYLDVGNRLENLFSLLTGTSLALENLFIYRGDENGAVISRRDRHARRFDPRECVRCTPCELANAIAAWLSQPRSFRSVEGIALGILRKGKLYIETQFLSLAQALEGAHRATSKAGVVDKVAFRKTRKKIIELMRNENVEPGLAERICASMSHANEPTFSTRLSELCARLSAGLLARMQIEPAQFVPSIAATRNFYTHAGGADASKRASRRLASISDLFIANQKMRSLLRGILLLHVGVPEGKFADLLVREITRWR